MITEKDFKKAIELLTELAELQNGTPLVRYEKEWNKTMVEVWDFINEFTSKSVPNIHNIWDDQNK
tara:strand:+ start:244 stop:438 length:195 start_codon:yes stop_codon:yes gene_type:complete